MVYLLEKLPNNFSQIGILYSIRFFLRALLEIPSGIIADGLGRKSSILFSYSLYISSFILYYLSNSFYELLIPSILFGIADAFRTGTHKAIIIEYLSMQGWQKHKTTYYGLTRSWSQTGSAVSSLIVFFLFLAKPDYGFIFLVTIIPYTLGLINIITYPRYLNLSRSAEKLNSKTRLGNNIKESISILINPKNIKLLTGTSLYFGFYHSMKDYLQPIFIAVAITSPYLLNFSDESIFYLPLLYFGIYIITTISSRNAGIAKTSFKTYKQAISTLARFGALSGICISILYHLKLPLLSSISFLFLFAIINLQRPTVVAYISSQFKNKNMATILSVESQIGSLIATFIALIGGFLTDALGIEYAIGIISVLLFLLSTINWFPKNEKDKHLHT
jgi:MFS family permease